MGTNNLADRESDTYINRVLNSKVAQSLKNYPGALNEAKIQQVRAGLKVECKVPVEKEVACDARTEQCLYKILEDPCEKVNLAKNPEYSAVLQQMNEILAARVGCATGERKKPRGKM